MKISPTVLAAFENEHGRMPTTLELFVLQEAVASVAIDRGDVGTYALTEGAHTMTPAQAAARREAATGHEYCGRLNCYDHGAQAQDEHALRMQGVALAVEIIRDHRTGFGSMHPSDYFVEGLEVAENVLKLALIDPLFVPPNYDELSSPNDLLADEAESTPGGERDR